MTLKGGAAAKRPTIYDLAALTNTSPSAVSSILNGTWKKRRISQKLAERVLKIAEEQGYSVNLQASLLRRERSTIVGMIVPKYDNRYFGAVAEQFEALARERGLFPVITCTQRNPDLELDAAKELLAYQVGCLVATGATDPDRISALCTAAGVRSLNLDLPGSSAPSVISDNYAGALALARLVLRRCESDFGTRRALHFVGGRPHDHNTAARLRGFLDAHAEHGLTVPAGNVHILGYAAHKAERAVASLSAADPIGIFVNSTISLEGVVRWVDSLPHDRRVRYGCFDWDPFAARLLENVGMVEQDVAGMLRIVFDLIEAADPAPERIMVPCIMRVSSRGREG